MGYAVKEIYYTLQGEGANAGRAAVFCRFAGCNLWTGHEKDRSTAVCKFCDTDFVGTDGPGGGRFALAEEIAQAVASKWPSTAAGVARPFVVLTGGEPMLQVDGPLVEAFHASGMEVAIETNGTIAVPDGIDWTCVSPKAGARLEQTHGDELKLAYPQQGASPDLYQGLGFRHFFLQPIDGPEREINVRLAVGYCLSHPQWRLSLQTHKFIGLP
jgi:7-carboxy-7-deazaguanine synthase (Cx14CxxC type)